LETYVKKASTIKPMPTKLKQDDATPDGRSNSVNRW